MNTVKVIIAAAAVSVSGLSFADLLYWQVQDAAFTGLSEAPATFTYATVRASDGQEPPSTAMRDTSANAPYYTLYTVDGDTSTSQSQNFLLAANGSSTSSDGGPQFFGAFDDNVTQFLFELWDSDGKLVGYANRSATSLAYAISPTGGSNTHGSDFRPFVLSAVVPEPTSALLLLLGMAGLALRRKRRA